MTNRFLQFAGYLCICCTVMVGSVQFQRAQAQQAIAYKLHRYYPTVSTGVTDTLLNPWAGGLNTPQFSSMDLNRDQQLDLVAFDRSDQTLLTWLWNPEHQHYRLAPEYAGYFPLDSLADWVLLKDLTCDGNPELLTGNNSNIRVWLHTGSPLEQRPFQLLYDRLYTTYNLNTPNQFRTEVYSLGSDIPGIEDIDFDGDTDFLVYNAAGTLVEYHENRAREDLNRCDTVVLVNASACWGHFFENYNFQTQVYSADLQGPGLCAGEFKTAHQGGALLPLNLDGDTLMDVIVSDNGPAYMLALFNGGNRQIASMTDQDQNFPFYDQRVFLPSFPAGYYQDLDHDGIRDLVVSPNLPEVSEDREVVWLYRNNGSDDNPTFNLTTKAHLVDQMLDLGTGGAAAWLDWNRDSIPDLLLACEGRYRDETTRYTGFELYINTGTRTQPKFALKSRNYLGLFGVPFFNGVGGLNPCPVDLDADGRPELIVGTGSGRLLLFDETGSGTDTLAYVLTNTNYLNLPPNTLRALTPTTADLDADGDPDLVLGYSRGGLILYENTGSAQVAEFTLRSTEWGKVSVAPAFTTLGYSAPTFADLDFDGRPELVVGNTAGRLQVYVNPTLSATDSFASRPWLSHFQSSRRGKPIVWTEPSDSLFHLVYGTRRGGFEWYLYRKDSNSTTPIDTLPHDTTTQSVFGPVQIQFQLSPNPSEGVLMLHYTGSGNPRPATVEIRNSQGQLVRTFRYPDNADGTYTLKLDDLPSGLYFCTVITHTLPPFTRKFVLRQ
jgi:hypothetical protein